MYGTINDRIYKFNKDRNLLDNGFDLKLEHKLLAEELSELFNATNEHELVDALDDLIVVATGAIYKLGYNPNQTMAETLKEIESRTGYINEYGKFQKVLTGDEYKADYSSCKLHESIYPFIRVANDNS